MDSFFGQIEMAKLEIEKLLINGIINETDIELLSQLTFIEVLDLLKSKYSKDKYLYQIYINPYLICIDKPYIDIDTIAKLLVSRYNDEIVEINSRYKEGQLNAIEFNNNKVFLKKLYFKSSMTGKKIMNYYKDDIVDNSLNVKVK